MTIPRVVVHIPHASLVVPDEVAPSFVLTAQELEEELLAMTDRYTDELFALPSTEARTIAFQVSRLVVDPERFTDDARELMSSKGMGVVYTKTSTGRSLRKAPTARERADLLARYYEPHHVTLTEAVCAAVDGHDSCLLVDGHSFSSRPLRYEEDQRADRPEICIGTDAHHTPASLRDAAVAAFERAGFAQDCDTPCRYDCRTFPPRGYCERSSCKTRIV